MEILGIGFPELVFILIVALIVMGPKDMEKTGKALGKWLSDFVTSPNWKAIKGVSKEIQNMPTRWMREANLEKEIEQMKRLGKDVKDANPMDTLNKKYPPPAKSQSVVTSPSGKEYPAVPSIGGDGDATPDPKTTPKDESDSEKDA